MVYAKSQFHLIHGWCMPSISGVEDVFFSAFASRSAQRRLSKNLKIVCQAAGSQRQSYHDWGGLIQAMKMTKHGGFDGLGHWDHIRWLSSESNFGPISQTQVICSLQGLLSTGLSLFLNHNLLHLGHSKNQLLSLTIWGKSWFWNAQAEYQRPSGLSYSSRQSPHAAGRHQPLNDLMCSMQLRGIQLMQNSGFKNSKHLKWYFSRAQID